jgi:hypothetical protein
MSAFSRFMSTAREILDEKDRAARTDQPPFFVRTTWLFAELEELALPDEIETFIAIKVARLQCDIAQSGRLVDQIHASSVAMTNPQRDQRQKICGWIKDQIAREMRR